MPQAKTDPLIAQADMQSEVSGCACMLLTGDREASGQPEHFPLQNAHGVLDVQAREGWCNPRLLLVVAVGPVHVDVHEAMRLDRSIFGGVHFAGVFPRGEGVGG